MNQSNETPRDGRLSARYFFWVAVLVGAQLACGILASFFPPQLRPFAILGGLVLSTMVAVNLIGSRRRLAMFSAVVLATLISLIAIYGLRRSSIGLDLLCAAPRSLESMALAIIGFAAIGFSSVVLLFASPASRWYRFRWPFVGVISALLVSLAVYGGSLGRGMNPSSMLREVVRLEREFETLDSYQKDQLSFYLTVLGRESEARSVRMDRNTETKQQTNPDVDRENEDVLELAATAFDWREAIKEIAARERIVIIMEDHFEPKHREWIEQTLEVFRSAGFRHYAAEGLLEWGPALKRRGFPVGTTGYYTLEPHFGNLLRRAISLDYELHEYETHLATEIADREEGQAETLAQLFESRPDCKMIIHAGPGHTMKQPVPGTGKWMAARLWEKTGVEPFCIFQSTHPTDANAYQRILRAVQINKYPKILIPPPTGLADYQFPENAIDALVIHPLTAHNSPAQRAPVFQSHLTRIRGEWQDDEWPVVIGVYRPGASNDAIATDQVMLRNGEREFELWGPNAGKEIRVHTVSGQKIRIAISEDREQLRIKSTRGRLQRR